MLFALLATFIEIVEAHHIARQILRRARIVVAVVAVMAPVIESVRRADVINLCVKLVRSAEVSLLPRTQIIGLPAPGGLAFTLAYGDDCVGPVGARLNPIVAGLKNVMPGSACRSRNLRCLRGGARSR